MNIDPTTQPTGSASEGGQIIPFNRSKLASLAHERYSISENDLFNEMTRGDIVLYSATGKVSFRTSAVEMATDYFVSSSEDIIDEATTDERPAATIALRIEELEDQVFALKCVLSYFDALKDERLYDEDAKTGRYRAAGTASTTTRQEEV